MRSDPDEDLKGSETRLWQLIAQRRRAGTGAEADAIDIRIWDLFGETWTIMFTDLSGFSRHVARFGIIHFLKIIHEQKEILLPVVAAHDGILIKIEADSFLILFKRPERAMACAVAMQHTCQRVNRDRAPEDMVLLCVGLGYGRILRIGDSDVFGSEVNAASKLGEDIANANEVLVTESVRDVLCGPGAGHTAADFTALDGSATGASVAYRAAYAQGEG
ncbi:MAG: adenylate/guanylate cyclase domain-containing protein [Myxococcales bacterium]|nr:adenylate/guanylate cyclase domain-containing protein [Myxococcales bacterium]